jgi:hypothetical protein
MTPYQFGPPSLVHAFHDRSDLDLVREMVGIRHQALIIEATEMIGAGPHERTITRTAGRNSCLTKTLRTKSGDVDVKIPNICMGSYVPSILERRRRQGRRATARGSCQKIERSCNRRLSRRPLRVTAGKAAEPHDETDCSLRRRRGCGCGRRRRRGRGDSRRRSRSRFASRCVGVQGRPIDLEVTLGGR